MKFLSCLTIFFSTIFLVPPVFSKVITQFVPSLSITEEYTDNYNRTQNNKDDEFSTIYGAGFSLGLLDKNGSLFLSYNPEYTDHAEYDENDT